MICQFVIFWNDLKLMKYKQALHGRQNYISNFGLCSWAFNAKKILRFFSNPMSGTIKLSTWWPFQRNNYTRALYHVVLFILLFCTTLYCYFFYFAGYIVLILVTRLSIFLYDTVMTILTLGHFLLLVAKLLYSEIMNVFLSVTYFSYNRE